MDQMLELFRGQAPLAVEDAKRELRACNAYTAQFGLQLSEAEIGELVQCRSEALQNAGRIEFGGGILPKLIYAFCDSPYLEPETYETTLAELQEAFYAYKSDAMDLYTDDELINLMVSVFNGRARGSAEYLIGTSLDALCRYARSGFDESGADEAGDLV